MKKWYKSRTIWFNIGTFIVICASELANITSLKPEFIVILGALGNIILRFTTSEGVE